MNPSVRQLFWRETKSTFGLGWPIIGAQLLWLSMVFVDNLLVARLGTAPLASLAMASGLFGLFNIVLIGSCSAVASMISSALAKDDLLMVRVNAKQGVVIAFGIALLMVGVFQVSDHLLILLGQDPALTPIARSYLVALSPGLIFHGLYVALRQVVEGHHDTRPSFVIAGAAAVLNFIFDQILIFGWGPIPAMGIEGAGYATAIVSAAMASLFLAYVWLSPKYRHLQLSAVYGYLQLQEAIKVLKVGLPMAAASLAEMAFFVAATFTMGTLGERTLASHQMAINAASFTFMIPLGLSFAVSIRVGHYFGKQDGDGLRRASMVGGILALLIACNLSAVFLLFPDFIASWYTSDPVLVESARALLIAAGLFQIFDCLQVTGMGILRGLQQGKGALINALFSFWALGYPAAYWWSHEDWFGALGIWYGLMFGLAVASVCHIVLIGLTLRRR